MMSNTLCFVGVAYNFSIMLMLLFQGFWDLELYCRDQLEGWWGMHLPPSTKRLICQLLVLIWVVSCIVYLGYCDSDIGHNVACYCTTLCWKREKYFRMIMVHCCKWLLFSYYHSIMNTL